jgi:hypothetical protein
LRAGNGGFKAASGTNHVENEIELSKMSEIDPQFGLQNGDPLADSKLSEAMRRLAASSRQSAPAEVGASLATAFRRHHTRRRRIRYASVAGLVACVALAVGTMFMHRSPANVSEANQASLSQVHDETPVATIQTPEIKAPELVTSVKPKLAAKLVRPKAATTNASYSRKFLALPGYDPAVPADELHVVRVRMSSNTLWQMGAPVNPDGVGRRVMADFVINQDGTPYAVRLVQ